MYIDLINWKMPCFWYRGMYYNGSITFNTCRNSHFEELISLVTNKVEINKRSFQLKFVDNTSFILIDSSEYLLRLL